MSFSRHEEGVPLLIYLWMRFWKRFIQDMKIS